MDVMQYYNGESIEDRNATPVNAIGDEVSMKTLIDSMRQELSNSAVKQEEMTAVSGQHPNNIMDEHIYFIDDDDDHDSVSSLWFHCICIKIFTSTCAQTIP